MIGALILGLVATLGVLIVIPCRAKATPDAVLVWLLQFLSLAYYLSEICTWVSQHLTIIVK